MNKRAMQLSINFLVVIILGLVLFSGGLVILKKVMCTGLATQCVMSNDLEQRMESMHVDGEIIALPYTQKESTSGIFNNLFVCEESSCVDGPFFPISVQNIFERTTTFKLSFEFVGFLSRSGETALPIDIHPEDWLAYFDEAFVLDFGKTSHRQFLIEPQKNAPRGTYSFLVRVCYSSGTENDPGCPAGFKLYDRAKGVELKVS